MSREEQGSGGRKGSLTPSHLVSGSWTHGSQSAVPGPAASASLGNLIEEPVLRGAAPDLLHQKLRVWGSADDVFTSPPGDALLIPACRGSTWPGSCAEGPSPLTEDPRLHSANGHLRLQINRYLNGVRLFLFILVANF